MNIHLLKKYSFHIVPIMGICVVIFIMGSNMLPFQKNIWVGHDDTQGARVQEFVYELRAGQIPPRVSSRLSEGHGYPLYNYYAPTAYWITSGGVLAGLTIPDALKLSYFASYLLSALSIYGIIYIMVRSRISALSAVVFFATSPYIAAEIFVRANLAEMWAFASCSAAIYCTVSGKKFFHYLLPFVFAAFLTAHNALTIALLPFYIVFLLKKQHRAFNLAASIAGIGMAVYFLLPAFAELHWTHASKVAMQTNYHDHFLCISQVWRSPWGFAGSAPGCELDGMTFMLGKILILCGSLGVFLSMIYWRIQHRSISIIYIGILFITIFSLFLSSYSSIHVWEHVPAMAGFQFPWRFLLVSLMGMIFLSGLAISLLPAHLRVFLGFGVMIVSIFMYAHLFQGQPISIPQYENTYLSDDSVFSHTAYHIPEYVPISVHMPSWINAENKSLNTQHFVRNTKGLKFNELLSPHDTISLPIHYLPYWHIMINNKEIIPQTFTSLGEPKISNTTNQEMKISVYYRSTFIERISTFISIGTIILWLVGIGIYHIKKIFNSPTSQKNEHSLHTNSLTSLLSLFFQSGYSAILGLAANLILTIVLPASTFGIYIITLSIISFLNYFSDIGLAASLVQKKNVEDIEYHTTFTVQQILILTLVSICAVFTRQIIHYYALPVEATYLFWSLLFAFFLSSLKSIPSLMLERDVQFQKIVLVQIVENTLFYIIVSILAVLGYGLYSFAIAVIVRSLVGTILMYTIKPYKPSIVISRECLRHMLSFGIPFQMNSFLALVKDDLIMLYLGKYIGIENLGYIGWAKRWAEAPIRIIMDNVNRILFPLFARIQDESERSLMLLRKTLTYQTLILAPVYVGAALLMNTIVHMIPRYAKWEPALPIFYLICISAFASSFSTPFINFLNAHRRVHTSLKFMIFWTAGSWICIPYFSTISKLYGYPVTLVILATSSLFVGFSVKHALSSHLLRDLSAPLVAAGGMAFFLWYARIVIDSPLEIGIAVCVSALIYFAILKIVFKWNVIQMVRQIMYPKSHAQ